MRLLLHEYRRLLIVPVTALGLVFYYLFVYVPLGRRAAELDAPLQKAWKALAVSLERTNATAIDFLNITNQLNETRQALAIVETARSRAAQRLELGQEVRARMNAPFQLVDYENERSKSWASLAKLAQTQKVIVEPSVYGGFPEHTADVRQPELLWPAFTMINALVTSALNAKVTALHSLEVPVVLTNSPATNVGLVLNEIPVQLEFSGSVSSVSKLIQSLPLRASELRDAGLPASSEDKPPLYIERLMIKKQSPEKPDEVRVWLRAVGFVLRE
jgi:hypothetical protein